MATLGEWTVILQFIVVVLNLRLTDKSKNIFYGLWLLSTVEVMSKCWKLMHDPQDNGFTLQSFELSKGIKGTLP